MGSTEALKSLLSNSLQRALLGVGLSLFAAGQEPEPGLLLVGRVVDEAGRGVVGAEVRVAPQAEEGAAVVDVGSATARTDAAGRFRMEGAPRGGTIDVRRDGYALVAPGEIEVLAGGRAGVSELHMHRVGALRVRLLDEHGVGIEDIEIEAQAVVPGLPQLVAWNGHSAFAWTDEEGGVVLDPVWAGVPLSITIWGAEGEEWRYERAIDGRLVPQGVEGADPIRIEKAEELTLSLALGPPLILRGRALRAGEARNWLIWAHIVELDPPGGRLLPTSELRARLDEEGRFQLRVFPAPGLGRLGLTVAHSRHRLRGEQGLMVLDDLPAAGGEREFELELDPDCKLSGHVRGLRDGEWGITALPEGLTLLQAEVMLGRVRSTILEGDGGFEIEKLPAGNYDLVVTQSSGSIGDHVQRFRSIQAGQSGLVLELDRKSPVRIRLRASAGERELSSMTVIVGRIEDARLFESAAHPPVLVRRAVGQASWPEEIGARGGERARIEGGGDVLVYRSFAARGDVFELPATQAGRYVLGVYARGPKGAAYVPFVSDPMEFAPGFHEVLFELRPTELLRGRVIGEDPDPLFVELHDEWGRVRTLRTSVRRFTSRVPVRGDGAFRLREAPVGALRLWIGTEDELDDGRFRVERLIELREGDEREFSIELLR